MSQRNRHNRGISLLEWAIAITITIILMSMLIPTILNAAERSRRGRAWGDVSGIAKAIAKMRQDTGNTTAACITQPTNLLSSTLVTACNNSALNLAYTMTLCNVSQQGRACWGGPYLSNVTVDPWSTPYEVAFDSTAWSVTVSSAGPDQKFGTTDDITYVQ